MGKTSFFLMGPVKKKGGKLDSRKVFLRGLIFSVRSLLILGCTSYTFSQNVKTLYLQPGPEEGKDAWVWSGDRTKEGNFGVEQSYNQGLHNVLRAEVWKWFGQTESDTIRSFLYFDLTEIPKSATVLEAKLSLCYYSNRGFTPQLGKNAVEISLVSETWEEDQINWVNQPDIRNDFRAELQKSESPEQDYKEIDIRSMVQEMVYFPGANYGIRLALIKEQPYNGLTFASSDHQEAGKRPKLFVRYQTNQ